MDKDTQNLVPKNKEDSNFIHNLKLKSISEIRDLIPQLLEWMQDINWPQANTYLPSIYHHEVYRKSTT
ncbi:DUF5071 domain-containing protein [Flavobacterium lindanitolerans]|uniref:DUF5071 domain-containing protein n=1 Tax=Flavobacterium lindanitolerans TaxID=428988 RepID=UPI00352A02A8